MQFFCFSWSNKIWYGLFFTALFILSCEIAGQYKQSNEKDAGDAALSYFLQHQQSVTNQGNGGGYTPDAVEQRFFNGRNANDNLGWCVNSAGDVNGDGYDDIVAGAPFADATGTDLGRVYVFFGGAFPNFVADITLTGSMDNEHFGKAAAGGGDYNGDGYDDIIVGAPNRGPSGDGAVYIFFGGTTMNNEADIRIDGAGSSRLGGSVCFAGDVNGDGYSDVIAGAAPVDAAGRAYVYYGNNTLDGNFDINLSNNVSGDMFGFSVSTAGDFNGDGYSDVLVGAYNSWGTGEAFLYFGGSVMNTSWDQAFMGETNGDFFGYSLSSAGDVNGDGFGDIIIGAWKNDYTSLDAGRAYIYYGASVPNGSCDVLLNSEMNAYDGFGCAVARGGDFNGDGFDDVIVGAFGCDNNGSSSGKAYIFFGGIVMDNIQDKILNGESADDSFGSAVGFGGDFNGDGLTEVLVGAWGKDLPAINGGAEAFNAGRGYLFSNSLSENDNPDLVINSPTQIISYFGMCVASAGDINGDGYPDVIVGASRATITHSQQGAAYIYFGGPMMDVASPDLTVSIPENGILFGTSVSSAGDVNGDGYDDFIVGAPNKHISPYYYVGAAYVYFGGYSPDAVADVILNGLNDHDSTFFGTSVSSAGDVNCDGYSDIIVGETGRDSYSGAAYIFLGGDGNLSTYDALLSIGVAPNVKLGTSVASAGDFNGDGFSDVIVGAITGGGDVPYAKGLAFLFYGGRDFNPNIDVNFVGYDDNDQFGFSVASAGDVNGDGFSDVIIGAPRGNNYLGKAYLFFGGMNPQKYSLFDVEFWGTDYVGYFGTSVSSAGDVNGDGFSDMIVGAYNNLSGTETNCGEAQIFFGGVSTDSVADIIMEGKKSFAYLGYSVACAGDLNKDGLSDVIVGPRITGSSGYANIYFSTAPPIKPRITSIRDVPNDQGGKVTVNWIRSGYDYKNRNEINNYEIQRSNAPVGGKYSWQNIGEVLPSKDVQYSFLADAPYDSMNGGNGIFYFRVIARSTNPEEFWKSNITGGYSVDNIAPSGIESFSGNIQGNNVKLMWKRNYEPDLCGYYLYRSDQLTIDPGIVPPIAIVKDTFYIDLTPPPGSRNYFIRAKDVHNNYSPLSTCLNNPLPVEISIFRGSVKELQVQLYWKTETEVEINKFIIERTLSESSEWVVMGEQSGSGNSNTTKEYYFTDRLKSPGKYLYRLKIVENSGISEYSNEIEVETGNPTEFRLSQNYPNPFNPETKINYQIPYSSVVKIELYNSVGERIGELINEIKETGYYTYFFSAATFNLSSGVYFYRIICYDRNSGSQFSDMKKMLYVK